MLDYVFAARPLLHLPVWSIYLVSLRYHHDLAGGSFAWEHLAMLTLLSLMATGTYYFNQVSDSASDALNNKVGFIARGFVSERRLLFSALVLTLGAVVCAYLISAVIGMIFTIAALFSYIYSDSVVRLKDRPIGGMFANAFVFGNLVALAVFPEMTPHNIGLLGWDNPFAFFFAVGAIHAMTTLPDVAGDSRTGKETIAVAFGRGATLLVATLCMGLAAWLFLASDHELMGGVAGISTLMIVINLVCRSARLELAAAKLPILLTTLVAGWFYPMYLVFIVVLFFVTRLYYKKRFAMKYPVLA